MKYQSCHLLPGRRRCLSQFNISVEFKNNLERPGRVQVHRRSRVGLHSGLSIRGTFSQSNGQADEHTRTSTRHNYRIFFRNNLKGPGV